MTGDTPEFQFPYIILHLKQWETRNFISIIIYFSGQSVMLTGWCIMYLIFWSCIGDTCFIQPTSCFMCFIIFCSSAQEGVNFVPSLPASVNFDGKVSWFYPILVKSTCQLKVDYFPWDQQSCELTYGSWTYDTSKVGFEIQQLIVRWELFLFTKHPNSSAHRGFMPGTCFSYTECLHQLALHVHAHD